MSQSASELRLAENEIIFRQYNESVQKGFDEIKQLAKANHQERLVKAFEDPLHFYCECANPNCHKRIMLTPKEYRNLHKRRDRFIVLTGHEVAKIEKVVKRFDDFVVVEKHVLPPTPSEDIKPEFNL